MIGKMVKEGQGENGDKGTYRIIPDFEILDFDPCLLCDTTDEEGSRCVRRVSLVGIGLDHYTLVHPWCVTRFIFAFVIWVNLKAYQPEILPDPDSGRPRDGLTA